MNVKRPEGDVSITSEPSCLAAQVREQVPALHQGGEVGRRWTYLDSAATTLTPQPVIDVLSDFYATETGSAGRGGHWRARRSTQRYEAARARVAAFLGAETSSSVVFTRGATHALNLIACGLRGALKPGDEVVISAMEHHANLLPWRALAEESGARLRVVPLNERGELDREATEAMIGARTAIVALTHVSNVLGTVNPVAEWVEMARGYGALSVIDGSQSVAHRAIDVKALGCDFFVCSAHKMYGPTGVGVLCGRSEALERLRPMELGGGMMTSVREDEVVFAELPNRLEAGTPPVAQAVGMAAAIDWMEGFGMEALQRHEEALCAYALERFKEVEGVEVVGSPAERSAVIAFGLRGVDAYDLGELLDAQNVAVRVGSHCAHPLVRELGLCATARASFGAYTDRDDIDALIEALAEAARFSPCGELDGQPR
ncbi:aminotransferase class V-fold PLP-dependent enzyme [Lujinxingia sediminis]|uniref:aminotransferase class V-fold PLP-dependent enzyme n=1 Tax=Lujinxingia sediminis TaxID=2480984 RepID=UPI0013E38B5B|nr:cysteine desulfurase [Lujinxingia sediminis]